MITTVRVIPPVLLLFYFMTAGAGETRVHRCTDAQGEITFQVQRCEHAGEQITVRDVEHGWTRLRQGEKTLLSNYRAEELRRRKGKSASRRRVSAKGESKACFGKRHRLERVRQKLRHGYKATEGMRLRSQRDEYQEYLDRYCS